MLNKEEKRELIAIYYNEVECLNCSYSQDIRDYHRGRVDMIRELLEKYFEIVI